MKPSAMETVDRLIEVHGEQGLSPSRADWIAIFASPADRPVEILNLLQFSAKVQTAQGSRSGIDAYRIYASGVSTAFAKVGAKSLYFGHVNHCFGAIANEGWDAAILSRYPSPEALADFWLDEEFIAAHSHRVDGVQRSAVMVMSSLR